MERSKRWHPSQESDELVFAVCELFLSRRESQVEAGSPQLGSPRRGSTESIARYLRERFGRKDLTREKIYPLFREAVRRNFVFLQPPRDLDLARRIAGLYGFAEGEESCRAIQVVDVRGTDAPALVAEAAADLVLSLIKKLGKLKQERGDADPRVHLGLGGGFSAMSVAKRLANRIHSDLRCPPLVLHAISAGGFLVHQPQKAPITYFSFFDDVLAEKEYVGLFSATVVGSEQYDQVISTPGIRESFARAKEVEIVVTSFASADDEHGLLNQYLQHLRDTGELKASALEAMHAAGWVGDVQFRPYTAHGPMLEDCPVKAVTLFDLPTMVELAATPGKYVVLLSGPCSECGVSKTEALLPLLTEPSLRLWTHLITDVQTASELVLHKDGQ
jgi:DNA-binding transcriptional regulator LsrR (DeoR family)